MTSLAAAAEALAGRDYQTAETLCLACLETDPTNADALQILGVLRRQTGRMAEAIALLREAVRLDAAQPHYASNLVAALSAAGLHQDAVDAAERAHAVHGDVPTVLLNHGVALSHLDRKGDAATCFRRAALMQPDLFAAHFYLGCTLEEDKQYPDAEAALRRALDLDPHHADSHNHLGRVLHAQKRSSEAAACFARATELAPGHAAAFNNLGSALLDQGLAQSALAAFRRAGELDPDNAGVAANIALAYTELMDIPSALAYSRKAIALSPDRAETRWTHSLQLLQAGQWQDGWEEYEWRWRLPEHPPFQGIPWWQGQPIPGATLLIVAEQGHGDTLQFLRFVPAAAASCGHVVLRLQRALVPLAVANFPMCTVIANEDPVPAVDFLVPLMSLPRLLRKGCEADSWPYLSPPQRNLSAWVDKVAALGPGRKVGLAWRGSPTHRRDHLRSVPLAQLAPLFEQADARFICLHPDVKAEETGGFDIDTSLAAGIADFADTAAMVAALDLVISVDSSPAHLAGALGRPCWVALPFCCDWRWGCGGEGAMWYPSLRLFRQHSPGDWHGVARHLAAELAGLGK